MLTEAKHLRAGDRHLFIDLYRSAVILLMLEGHVFRTFLSIQLQQTPLFQIHEIIHGLSAPAFLFGAGVTFVISTRKRWEDYHRWGVPLARRVGRFLLIIGLGLVLHLPYFSLRKIIDEGTSADLLQLFQCDVLTCIGVGLLLLQAIVFFFKTEKRFYGFVIPMVIFVSLLTPLVWDIDFLRFLPAPLAQLLNSSHGSAFPLFPYAGFLFAGVIVSRMFLVAAEQQRTRKFVRRLLILGVSCIVGGLLFDAIPAQIYPTYNFWYTSPNYFLTRLGFLMLAMGGFWILASRLSSPKKIFTILGRESLFVYVLHLLVIYGSVINPDLNLQKILGTNFGVMETSLIFILFTLFILGCAMAWQRFKEQSESTFVRQVHCPSGLDFQFHRLVQIAISGMFLHYLFTRQF